jgi:hypothetical protein
MRFLVEYRLFGQLLKYVAKNVFHLQLIEKLDKDFHYIMGSNVLGWVEGMSSQMRW